MQNTLAYLIQVLSVIFQATVLLTLVMTTIHSFIHTLVNFAHADDIAIYILQHTVERVGVNNTTYIRRTDTNLMLYPPPKSGALEHEKIYRCPPLL